MAGKFNERLLNLFPRRMITPLTASLSLVVGISGVMMFFHLGEGLVKSAHEWLGMAFVLTMMLHLLSNWSALSNHFRHGIARAGVIAIVLSTGIFMGAGASSGSGGPEMVFRALQEAPVATVAALFQVDPVVLRKELEKGGVVTDSAEQSLADAAVLSGLSERDAVKQLIGSVGRIR